ncbi:MAG: Cytochrome c oxidase subunit type, partial [Mycobacterium sp.]|nr:Cytochrome c oxidase subunit type [Mycobacterium sp.]
MLGYITTTSHKTIGVMYMITSFVFFALAGVMAELMRAELARPGLQFLSNEQYNQLFTIHGTVMMFLFAPALAFGFANFIFPLQIGAPDVSCPRLNALAYWMYAFGGTMVVAGFVTPVGAADFCWFAFAPLNSSFYSTGIGADLWIFGLAL